MSDARSLKRMCEFEWASACQYIIYISSVAGLEEINSARVISFPLGKLGPAKLVARKESVLGALKENRRSLECFVDVNRDELEAGEMAVIRSMYVQIRDWITIVEGHLRVAKMCLGRTEVDLFALPETEVSDEPLF